MPAVLNDSSLTLDDIILRVAEACGVADYSGDVAAVPTSPHDYDMCRRAVNDGIEMIYRGHPRWRFLMRSETFTLSTDGTAPDCIDGDAGRYLIPWYITGNPIEERVTVSGSQGTTYLVPVVAMKFVRNGRSSDPDSTGPPRMVAFDRVAAQTMAGRSQWQMVIYPNPDSAYTLSATFRCFAPKMVGRADRHIMGAEHDQTVIAAGIYAKKLTDSKDPVERENYRMAYAEALQQSIALDRETVPRSLGPMTDPSVGGNQLQYDIGNRIGMTVTNGIA